jgi:MinD-like ATPase involved in chromosome partitioning or flagellar assembly
VPFFKLAPQSKASQAIISLAERLQHFETKNKGRGMGLMAQEAMPLS